MAYGVWHAVWSMWCELCGVCGVVYALWAVSTGGSYRQSGLDVSSVAAEPPARPCRLGGVLGGRLGSLVLLDAWQRLGGLAAAWRRLGGGLAAWCVSCEDFKYIYIWYPDQ